MKEIPLTQGKVALVDDEDYERVSCLKWHVQRNCRTFYAKRNTPSKTGNQGAELMHRTILNNPDLEVDHIDGNGLNNQRSNLHLVSHRRNQQNRHHPKTSRFPGVYWKKKDCRWVSQIKIDGETIYLGSFLTEEEAYFRYLLEAYFVAE
jgi:hypothetical protein